MNDPQNARLQGAVDALQKAATELEKHPSMDPVKFLRQMADNIVYARPGVLE